MQVALLIFPPYLGAGVRVEYVAPDWREIRVAMGLHWYNRNAVGTHFGGSLYAMVDPHLMLLLMQLLGRGYVVWDQAARIEFKKPGRGTVRARIAISEDALAAIRRDTAVVGKARPEFAIEIRDAAGGVVATVRKTLYVRRKAVPAAGG
jgi:acyl-coenzyme A thioesterase PaaI-like protein